MNREKKYYEAYDDRYNQVYQKSLKWLSALPSKIVEQTMQNHNINKKARVLEIDCGEGRDAFFY